MTEDRCWLERLIESVNRVAPSGIAALALIFGILTVVMMLAVLKR